MIFYAIQIVTDEYAGKEEWHVYKDQVGERAYFGQLRKARSCLKRLRKHCAMDKFRLVKCEVME